MSVSFLLAEDYARDTHGHQDFVLMPKLNGVRARYVPGIGFVTRDQKVWHESKLRHISPPRGYSFDGELYVHGWKLQRINGAVSVNSKEPCSDTPFVQYHIYDIPDFPGDAWKRMEALEKIEMGHNCQMIKWLDGTGKCHDKKSAYKDFYVAQGYEGLMMKKNGYFDGRCDHLVRWKAWQFDTFKFVRLEQEFDKDGGPKDQVGALWLETEEGQQFKVGSGFTKELKTYLWVHRADPARMPTRVKIRYLDLSSDGLPTISSFQEAYYAK